MIAVVVYVAIGLLGVSVLLGVAVGRVLRRNRLAREAAGERPVVDDPEHLGIPPLHLPPIGARHASRRPPLPLPGWLVVDARVVHDTYRLGVVNVVWHGSETSEPRVGVIFDDGIGRWVHPTEIDPAPPENEAALTAMWARQHEQNPPSANGTTPH